jgi:hypothetical protein
MCIRCDCVCVGGGHAWLISAPYVSCIIFITRIGALLLSSVVWHGACMLRLHP